MRKNFATAFYILAILCHGTTGALAQIEAGTVKPSAGRTVFPIAIVPFNPTGGQALNLSLASVIMNDLALSGYFTQASNERFIAEANRLDQSRNAIVYDEWKRIGASYLVKGNYQVAGKSLVVEFMMYDVVAGRFIFGRKYDRTFEVGEARRQAHQISNEIIEKIIGEDGYADTQIAFIRGADRLGRSKQVCIMDADGHNVRAVTPAGELAATPCWGARGTEIYFTSYRDFNPDLWGVIPETGRIWRVLAKDGLNASPDWSEINQLIALTLSKDGNSEIYVVQRGEGRGLRRLTVNPAIDCAPCWSPDGRQIAFTSDRSGSAQIWVMDARTQAVRRLTTQGTWNDGAAWAPRGSNRIAFASRVGGVFQICTINPDGTGLQQITRGSNNEDPAWAPDGWTLAFTSDRLGPGRRQIFTMFADGSNVRQLTSGGECKSPGWSQAR